MSYDDAHWHILIVALTSAIVLNLLLLSDLKHKKQYTPPKQTYSTNNSQQSVHNDSSSKLPKKKLFKIGEH